MREIRRIETPTLLIWGEHDRYLGRWVPNLRLKRIPDSSHCVQIDTPERVSQRMIDFLHAS